MVKILGIDTSTELCSLAISDFQGKIIETHSSGQQKQHSQTILALIQQLLVETKLSLSELDAIAFGRGPGAFTGLRLAAGIAQGIAYAKSKPVIGVSSLEALARSYYIETHDKRDLSLLATIDARMHEIYFAFYQLKQGEIIALSEEQLLAPQLIQLPKSINPELPIIAVGSGCCYQSILERSLGQPITEFFATMAPCGRAVIELAKRDYELGQIDKPEFALPTYLRNKVVNT